MKLNSKNQNNQTKNQDANNEISHLTIHSIFVKDLSYESPSTPQVFGLPWDPGVKFDIQVMRRVIDQVSNLYEVILHATITSKINDKNHDNKDNKKVEEVVAFLIDIKLAGMFTIVGLQDAKLDEVLSTTAPMILFPYLTENISSLVTRGGFPQFILPPVDFFTLYRQQHINNYN